MGESASGIQVGRNLTVYLFGVGLAAGGALGLAGAIELSLALAGVLFSVGLLLVLTVHEFLNGPL